MRLSENWTLLRLKLLPVGIVLGLIFFSLFKRTVRYFFAVLLFFVTVSPAYSASWLDVLSFLETNNAGPGCIYYVSETATPSWRIWKRCGGSVADKWSYYKTSILSGGQYIAGGSGQPYQPHQTGKLCDGTSSSVSTYDDAYLYSSGVGACDNAPCTAEKTFKLCDGSVSSTTETNVLPASNTLVSPWSVLFTVAQRPCYLGKGNNSANTCTSLDVLAAEFVKGGETCNYAGLQALGVTISTGTGYDYRLNYPDTGTTLPCGQCVPDGTKPLTGFVGTDSLPANGGFNTDGTIACYFKDIVGDPSLFTDPIVPSTTGGGVVSDVGFPAINISSTETTENTKDGQTEIVTTTTQTTTTQSGATTTTEVKQVANCIDLNPVDGVSDVSGLPCGGSVSSSTTSPTGIGAQGFDSGAQGGSLEGGGGTKAFYPQLAAPAPYSNQGLPLVTDFGSLLSTFFADMRATQLFSKFTLSDMVPSGGGSPVYSVDFGRFGNHSVDFSGSQYTTAFSIIKGFMLLLASYLAVRVVVLKR